MDGTDGIVVGTWGTCIGCMLSVMALHFMKEAMSCQQVQGQRQETMLPDSNAICSCLRSAFEEVVCLVAFLSTSFNYISRIQFPTDQWRFPSARLSHRWKTPPKVADTPVPCDSMWFHEAPVVCLCSLSLHFFQDFISSSINTCRPWTVSRSAFWRRSFTMDTWILWRNMTCLRKSKSRDWKIWNFGRW